MTHEQRIAALRQFGYSEREAAFLCLAALHGGYFLRRQYCRFLGTGSGRPDDLLVCKVLSLGHGRRHSTGRRTFLYHLCSRTLYNAIGEPDNRNRHPRPPYAIKARLMALDYVLAYPGRHCLNTEHEKVDYFCRVRAIPLEFLPAKVFRAEAVSPPAFRYFVDHFPVFVDTAEDPSIPVVSFCYIDEGVIAAPAFETYLRNYAALFALLGRFRVVHVSTVEDCEERAKAAFRRFFDLPDHPAGRRYGSFLEGLLAFLRLEDRYQTGRLDLLSAAALDELAVLRRMFRGRGYEPFFEFWDEHGDEGIARLFARTDGPEHGLQLRFAAHHMSHDYGFL